MEQMNDSDVWKFIDPRDLWIYDKLILSKRLGYNCGPAGIPPTKAGEYVVRPCVNFRMMGHGASLRYLTPNDDHKVPDGYFWCEKFEGKHISIDYHHGKQVLAVEAFKEDPSKLDRFSAWQKVDYEFLLPSILEPISKKYEWFNVEIIDDKVIEVHLRYNDDFRNHDADVVIPIWKEEYYHSPSGDRIGFIIKKDRP